MNEQERQMCHGCAGSGRSHLGNAVFGAMLEFLESEALLTFNDDATFDLASKLVGGPPFGHTIGVLVSKASATFGERFELPDGWHICARCKGSGRGSQEGETP